MHRRSNAAGSSSTGCQGRTRKQRPAFRDTPTGSRTPVSWLRTKYPRPLDDGGVQRADKIPTSPALNQPLPGSAMSDPEGAQVWQVPEPLAVHDVRLGDGTVTTLRRHGNPSGPRIVVSHGNSLAIDLYYPFWSLFADEFDLVLYDLRNHGWNTTGPLGSHKCAHAHRRPPAHPGSRPAGIREEAAGRRVPLSRAWSRCCLPRAGRSSSPAFSSTRRCASSAPRGRSAPMWRGARPR